MTETQCQVLGWCHPYQIQEVTGTFPRDGRAVGQGAVQSPGQGCCQLQGEGAVPWCLEGVIDILQGKPGTAAFQAQSSPKTA